MALGDNIYTIYAVNIANDVPILLNQCTDGALDTGLREIIEGADGEVDARYAAVMEQRPVFAFTTTSLQTALGAAGISGRFLDIDDTATYGPLEAWFQKLAEGSTRAAGASHLKMIINEGMLLPRTLRASQGQVASLRYDALATYDGSNEPIAISTAAVSGTPGVSALWTLGPVVLNGTEVNGVVDLEVPFGIREIVEGADGEVWPRYSAIMERRPAITFTTPDANLFNTLTLTGAAQGATDSLIYLRQMAEGSTRTAIDGGGHIKIAVDKGRIFVENITGSHGQRVGTRVRITPTYDGSNAVLAITTNTDIVLPA